jgi:hypothetical protein
VFLNTLLNVTKKFKLRGFLVPIISEVSQIVQKEKKGKRGERGEERDGSLGRGE